MLTLSVVRVMLRMMVDGGGGMVMAKVFLDFLRWECEDDGV